MRGRTGNSSMVKRKSEISSRHHPSRTSRKWKWRLPINAPSCLRKVLENKDDLISFKRMLQKNGFQLEEGTDSLRVLKEDQPLPCGFVFRGETVLFFMDNPIGSTKRPKHRFSQSLSEELALLLRIANQLIQSSTNVHSRRRKKLAKSTYVCSQKTKHFGITTSEKRDEHIFVPAPVYFENESDSSFNVDVGTFPTGVKTAKTQRNIQKIRFNKTESML